MARFHLGNGAQLERINWLADTSERGLREAHGIMVNYRYVIGEIERNHEAYANAGTVAAAKSVRALLRAPGKARMAAPAKRQLVLPGPEPAAAGRETTDSEQP